VAVKVILWPASIVGASGVIAPATKAEFTLTMLASEHFEAAENDESVTL